MKTIKSIIVLLLLAPYLCLADGLPDKEHIVVSGEGEVEAVPDIAEITVRIFKTSSSLAESKRHVDEVSRKTIDSALKFGLEKDDIEASKIYSGPEYGWAAGKKIYRGETVRRTIKYKISDIDNYGVFLQVLSKSNVSEIARIGFAFSRKEELKRKALSRAIDVARKKAESIAAAFGVKLGQVFSITEDAARQGPRPYAAEFAAAPRSGSPHDASYIVGKRKIRAGVRVVFRIEKK
ncbi:MAG: SIMPL domain-containing protein [Proteobacteria bacterium]|nr:SIMPL domain-containing protein [Pseudomonadota bacterium]